jgi:hypothetical protein
MRQMAGLSGVSGLYDKDNFLTGLDEPAGNQ